MLSKRSFFEKLTGAVSVSDEADESELQIEKDKPSVWTDGEDAELTIDMYQTQSHIVIKTIAAGVRPEDLDISISRDMVTVRGRRQEQREVEENGYIHKELYWGAFSRTVVLPEEVEPEDAEATEKHGLLTLRLPKINKHKQSKVRVKSI